MGYDTLSVDPIVTRANVSIVVLVQRHVTWLPLVSRLLLALKPYRAPVLLVSIEFTLTGRFSRWFSHSCRVSKRCVAPKKAQALRGWKAFLYTPCRSSLTNANKRPAYRTFINGKMLHLSSVRRLSTFWRQSVVYLACDRTYHRMRWGRFRSTVPQIWFGSQCDLLWVFLWVFWCCSTEVDAVIFFWIITVIGIWVSANDKIQLTSESVLCVCLWSELIRGLWITIKCVTKYKKLNIWN